ncbi:hypothetical protein GCK72_015852 [Caenorhabditis remanei]|uniref:Uncharacterized protein n=1 Tax=Caenorhabditis remanei TaxID=31234 RepID=A0A6A5GXW9_CAERE|nr:hypothetical protein GCK72_015852 [Caenorhabditis remanei]KAF1759385.1 hypothetical protein GCK72_015852 [Caenorhabditis remanei]
MKLFLLLLSLAVLFPVADSRKHLLARISKSTVTPRTHQIANSTSSEFSLVSIGKALGKFVRELLDGGRSGGKSKNVTATVTTVKPIRSSTIKG